MRTTVATLIITAAAVAWAPVAHADNYDYSSKQALDYLDCLANNHIQPDTASDGIDLGRKVSADLHSGMTALAVQEKLVNEVA
jgi:hypothetical protein